MASRSPTAVTPLPKVSAPEEDAMSMTTAPQAVPFPPPQTFDIIPPLHNLLLRLLAPSNNVADASHHTGAGGAPGASSTDAGTSQSQSQQQQSSMTGGGSAGGSTAMATDIAALGSNAPPPLDIKDLTTEASSIKIRVQKAQAVVESLPDVQRSVDDQNQEIKELEDKIARLQSVISDFGRRAGKVSSQGTRTQET